MRAAVTRFLGWRVHGWSWPIIWWARRKPRSDFRQWVWAKADAIEGRRVLRFYAKLGNMSEAELAAYINRKYGNKS